jgi:hypothetical protein
MEGSQIKPKPKAKDWIGAHRSTRIAQTLAT